MQPKNLEKKNEACLNKYPPDSIICNKIYGKLSVSFDKHSKMSLFFMLLIVNRYNNAFCKNFDPANLQQNNK